MIHLGKAIRMGRSCTAGPIARLSGPVIFATLLAACGSSSSSDQAVACPSTAIVAELSVLNRFGGPTTTPDEQAFYGEITSARTACDYDDDAVDLTVSIATVYDRPPGRPASGEPIEFFVAVARPDGTVIGKRGFTTTVEFRQGEIRAGYQEDIEIALPLPGGPGTGPGFLTYVGFQLSASELAHNREVLR